MTNTNLSCKHFSPLTCYSFSIPEAAETRIFDSRTTFRHVQMSQPACFMQNSFIVYESYYVNVSTAMKTTIITAISNFFRNAASPISQTRKQLKTQQVDIYQATFAILSASTNHVSLQVITTCSDIITLSSLPHSNKLLLGSFKLMIPSMSTSIFIHQSIISKPVHAHNKVTLNTVIHLGFRICMISQSNPIQSK